MIAFDNVIADIFSNEKRNLIVTELSVIGSKLNISFAFITQSYFTVPNKIRLNSTCYFIMKITQTNNSFDKSHLIIHLILTLRTLLKIFLKSNCKTIYFLSDSY